MIVSLSSLCTSYSCPSNYSFTLCFYHFVTKTAEVKLYWCPSLVYLTLTSISVSLLQTDMMTRAELAFSALDKNKKGYITAKELMKLTKKLSKDELMGLMAKVICLRLGQKQSIFFNCSLILMGMVSSVLKSSKFCLQMLIKERRALRIKKHRCFIRQQRYWKQTNTWKIQTHKK